MCWILIQPADDEESQKATAHLKNTGECLFDLSKHGAQLKPVFFGSHSCDYMESEYRYFNDKVAAGRWEIGQNFLFLWGCLFYWLCDCSAAKDIIEYDGCIYMVQQWAQELLGYNVSVLHTPNIIMCDVDALSRQYGKLIVAHLCISNIIHDSDKRHQPQAYQRDYFISSRKSKMNIEGIDIETRPIFTEHNIFEADIFNPDNNLDDIRNPSNHSPKIIVLITQPMKFIIRSYVIIEASTNMNVAHRAFEIIESTSHNILSIEDVTHSLQAWSKAHLPGGFQWTLQ